MEKYKFNMKDKNMIGLNILMAATNTLGCFAKNQNSHQDWADSFRIPRTQKIYKKAFSKMAKGLAFLEFLMMMEIILKLLSKNNQFKKLRHIILKIGRLRVNNNFKMGRDMGNRLIILKMERFSMNSNMKMGSYMGNRFVILKMGIFRVNTNLKMMLK